MDKCDSCSTTSEDDTIVVCTSCGNEVCSDHHVKCFRCGLPVCDDCSMDDMHPDCYGEDFWEEAEEEGWAEQATDQFLNN